MNNQPDPQQKEDKAIHALITASLHVRGNDVDLEEIRPYLEPDIVLSPEDEAALKKIGPDPLAKSIVTAQTSRAANVADQEILMALNRKKPDSGFSPKTTEELARKRQELLERLRKKNKLPL